jgi:hypothetical protein
MQETGEWGQFFPPWISGDAYNDTIANDYFPLARADAVRRGWNWRVAEQTLVKPSGTQVNVAELMSMDAPTELLAEAIACEKTGRLYKIIHPELKLLQKLRLAIPRFHPEVRYADRTQRRNPRRVWKRSCDKCRSEVTSSYCSERAEIVFCDSCYRQAAIG